MERLKTLTRIGKATGQRRGYYFINRRKHNSITETERPLVGGGVHAHTRKHEKSGFACNNHVLCFNKPLHAPFSHKGCTVLSSSISYGLFLLLSSAFLHNPRRLCVVFHFRFAPAFHISYPIAPYVGDLKQPLQCVFLPPFDHPIV